MTRSKWHRRRERAKSRAIYLTVCLYLAWLRLERELRTILL